MHLLERLLTGGGFDDRLDLIPEIARLWCGGSRHIPMARWAIRPPKGVLTPQLLDAMRVHKQMLLDLVETFQERAAILEYSAGLARDDAEWLAWQELGGEGPPRALAS